MSEWDAPESRTSSGPAPIGLLVVAIAAILLGLLGTCAGGMGVVSLATQGIMQDFATSSMPPDQAQAYEAMLESMRWIQPISAVLVVLNLLVSLALVVGAALSIGRIGPWAGLFSAALLGSIFVDGLQGIVGVLNFALIQQPMSEYMAASLGGAAAPPGLEGIMGASMLAGLIIGVGWALGKVVFEVVALVIVRRSRATAS